jgi:hypothetical protein
MWVYTQDGFFSAIQDRFCNERQVAVRARCKADRDRLADWLEGAGYTVETVDTPEADYHYRLIIGKAAWAAYLHDAAEGIDYPNFKNAALLKGDRFRAEAYHDCWSAMYGFQFRKEDNKHKANMK